EVTGGAGGGDARDAEGVQGQVIVAEQVEVIQGGAPRQDVVGEAEGVGGLVVGAGALEAGDVFVGGVGPPQALSQQEAQAQAAEGAGAELGAVVVADVAVGEEAALPLLAGALAQAVFQAALAAPELFRYCRLHLKPLTRAGKRTSGDTVCFPEV